MATRDVFFIGDTSRGTNWGSQATSMALREFITEYANIQSTEYTHNLSGYNSARCFHNNQSFLKYMFRNFGEAALEKDIKEVGRTILEYQDSVPRTVEEFSRFFTKARNNTVLQKELKKIRNSDMVVVNGEGLMWKAGRFARTSLFLLYVAKKLYGKECYLVNTTIGFEDPIFVDMLKHVLPEIDEVIFREPISGELYDQEIQSDNYRVAADAAFTHLNTIDSKAFIESVNNNKVNIMPFGTANFDPSEPYVCVAGSSIYAIKQNTPVEEYYSKLCEELNDLNAQIVLVVSADKDDKFLREVSTRQGLPLIGLSTSTFQAVNLLANAEAYIGGRYHPSIFSILGGTPIIPFEANTHKIESLLKLVGTERKVYSFDKINEYTTDIYNEVEEILTGSYEDTSEYRYRAEELSNIATENVHFLMD